MAVIFADGLFHGDRLRRCSDLARLYYPYLFLGADGFGRFEVNHERLLVDVLDGFRSPPTRQEYYAILREFHEQHLLFLYEVDGRTWGQFYCRPNSLPRWKTRRDHRSPVPPEPDYKNWLFSYSAESSQLPKISEILGKLPRGKGEGFGFGTMALAKAEGKEKPTSPEKPAKAAPETGAGTLAVDFASRIHRRHPARKCSRKEVTRLLGQILKRTDIENRGSDLELLTRIDSNHQAWSTSDDWTKEASQYCPGLDRWLRLAGEKYLEAPASRNGMAPRRPNATDEAIEIVKRDWIGGSR